MTWPHLDADHAMVSAEQMAELENQIISSGLPEEALMEKVGQKMAGWVLSRKQLLNNGVLVLVGPGHNGGDGLVIARELHLSGIKVSFWCPFPLKKPLTIKQYAHSIWLGIKELKKAPDTCDKSLWIDSVFGLGQSKALPAELAALFEARETCCSGKLISIDLPSGLCSNTGKPFDRIAAHASFTLTVGLFKKGLIQDSALPYVGRLVRFDIGIPEKVLLPKIKHLPLRICASDITSFDFPSCSPLASKYQRGRALIIAGSEKYKGAALLALKGALASGVGSIQAALPKMAANSLFQFAPEIVLADLLENSSNRSALISKFFNENSLDRIDALLLGPGLGISDESWDSISMKLIGFSGLLVLDADALNRLSLSREGYKWLAKRRAPTLITPHQEEFRRLFPFSKSLEPIDLAKEAAIATGAGVVLKGAHTIFSSPSGQVWQLGDSAPWVARAGLGDVLAGFLTGVGAIGFSSPEKFDWEIFAGSTLLHAEAARICPEGSNASSIADCLAILVKRINANEYLEKDI